MSTTVQNHFSTGGRITEVRHEGIPEGRFEDIDGIDCYVATPSFDYPKDQLILVLTNVFGAKYIKNQLVADSFAASGFKIIMPNLFQDILLPEMMEHGKCFDFGEWFSKNGLDYSTPRVHKVVDALKKSGVSKIGVAAYCYGARAAFELAFENKVDVVVASHPSFLRIPQDFEDYLPKAKAPLLINSCSDDEYFPAEAQEQADKILGGGKFTPGYVRKHWEGCSHGFTIRGDIAEPQEKIGKEEAFKLSADFLHKHLYGISELSGTSIG